MAIQEGEHRKSATVLAFSDDPLLLELLSELSVILGPHTEIESCATESRATDLCESGKKDLIVIDAQTKGVDALQLLSAVVTLQPKVPALVITGPKDDQLTLQALRNGAHDCLTKPLVRDLLAASLQRVAQIMQYLDYVRAKDRFVANMAHSIRTPLNIILNAVQLIKMEEADASTRDLAIDMIEQNVKQLATLLVSFECPLGSSSIQQGPSNPFVGQ